MCVYAMNKCSYLYIYAWLYKLYYDLILNHIAWILTAHHIISHIDSKNPKLLLILLLILILLLLLIQVKVFLADLS